MLWHPLSLILLFFTSQSFAVFSKLDIFLIPLLLKWCVGKNFVGLGYCSRRYILSLLGFYNFIHHWSLFNFVLRMNIHYSNGLWKVSVRVFRGRESKLQRGFQVILGDSCCRLRMRPSCPRFHLHHLLSLLPISLSSILLYI